VVDCRRPVGHDDRKLLDVANEPGYRPGPGRLASGDVGPWTLDVLCACECRGLLYTPPLLRGAAVGLLSLLRNEGGSVGTSLAQTIQERRDQFHILRLGESLDSFNAAVISFFDQARALFLQQTGDPSAAQQLALQTLENLRQQQASSLAYFDVFLLLAVVTLALIPVVLLMKRSVAEKGAHVGHE
jgi:DHA2 family multidrug resistance protein